MVPFYPWLNLLYHALSYTKMKKKVKIGRKIKLNHNTILYTECDSVLNKFIYKYFLIIFGGYLNSHKENSTIKSLNVPLLFK